ncbi:hypothetical protein ACFR9U_00865 [Halorientalis brevis]|uniref:Uncharacterized protein n=1 Tax=Halorientalis brevis TaxID=1126241 RepID=A0ABD6C5V6_9EURY|nr:hypothetical protein [Halorientalis brevis]
MANEFDEVMTAFADEMEAFEERMRAVSDALSKHEADGPDATAPGSPAAGD